jgi:hypothetical protein
MKLTPVRRKGIIAGYTAFINTTEAATSGLIDENGEAVEFIKEVDGENFSILLKGVKDGRAKDVISSISMYKMLPDLQDGKEIKTARNDHYTMVGNILYRQKHQSYLRGEQKTPYAELINGIFFRVRNKKE